MAAVLWRETILDDLAWTATITRLTRMGDFIDQGMSPAAAAEAVALEMGPEPHFDPEPSQPPSLAARCDPERRGVS